MLRGFVKWLSILLPGMKNKIEVLQQIQRLNVSIQFIPLIIYFGASLRLQAQGENYVSLATFGEVKMFGETVKVGYISQSLQVEPQLVRISVLMS